jgi:opacity protein-like surface antigen
MSGKVFLGLAMVALLALVGGGCGSSGSGTELGIYGTQLEGGDLGEGYGAGVKLEYNPIDLVSIDARASYVELGKADVVPLEVAGLLNLPLFWERFTPYGGVGVGYYVLDGKNINLDNDWGYFPLLGLEVGFHKLSLMCEARYITMETKSDGGGDVDMEGLGVNLGAIIRF